MLQGQTVDHSKACKCLGIWLYSNLTGKRTIEENVKNARKAFFLFGNIGAFHGRLNPLSGRSIFETCVIPIALYRPVRWGGSGGSDEPPTLW